MRRLLHRLAIAAAPVALCPVAAGAQPIRSGRVLVPIDVRVLDRDGKPVTGLTAEDFTVTEDGVPQTVSVFEAKSGAAGLPGQTGTTTAAPEGRTFLILLRRMWLASEPFETSGAIVRFIRKLGPHDRVAVSSWRRVSEFTTRHEAVVDIVERLQRYQAAADQEKRLQLFEYMFRPIPPHVEAELNAVFQSRGLTVRTLPRAEHPRVNRLVDDVERGTMLRAGGLRPMDAAAAARAVVLDLFTGIQQLRYEPGEKHLVYFARGGLLLPSVQDDRHLARLASDARIALHVIQTGGALGPGGFDARAAGRTVAEMTGGTASFADYPAKALTRVDAATQGGYRLGYYPTDQSLDDRHRRITVTVKGLRGTTIHYRRTYRAQPPEAAIDDRLAIIQDRILMAGGYDRVIPDIKLDATIVPSRDSVTVKLKIGAGGVSFDGQDDMRTGALELAYFCTDRRERLVGEFWQTLNMKLGRAAFERIQTEGLRHEASFRVSEFPAWCKVVAYDYAGDRLGSTVVKLR